MPQFVPRERKHRRLAKQKHFNTQDGDSSNRETIIPESKSERDLRRAQLAAELREQQPADSKVSGKKRKRLDKYIETKLKKEENLELLKKLAAHKVDTTLFRSSKKLGRVTESKRERLSKALQERNAGIDVNGNNDKILFQKRNEASEAVYVQDDDSDSSAQTDPANNPIVPTTIPSQPSKNPTVIFGGGLKRPLDVDDAGNPVLKKRKRRKAKKGPKPVFMVQQEDRNESNSGDLSEDDDEDEWNGFESDTNHEDEEVDGDSMVDESDSESRDEGHEDVESSPESGGDSTDSDPESEPGESDHDKAPRVSAFKAWADSQRSAALGFTPSLAPTLDASLKVDFSPRAASPDLLLQAISTADAQSIIRPTVALTIPRPDDIQSARLALPVVQEEQKIMEAIHSHPVVVICGATGSGKTTQVPQMMFESGYGSQIGRREASEADLQSRGMIGVTQPRRVAAMSVAERVATEVGSAFRQRIAHQVRYDTNVNPETAIKFMTDGILLREISQDFVLSKYSAIVIDEAHERSVNTDILIGMLSRIVDLRTELTKEDPAKHCPLKLVIMSATLRVADFAQNSRLFRKAYPPIVQAEGRQYPVVEHFSRRTRRDYLTEMITKVSKGHRKLPAGGMLVFLTAQNEIETAIRKVKEKLGSGTITFDGRGQGRDSSQRPTEVDDFEDDAPRAVNDFLEGEDSDAESDPEIMGLDQDVDDDEFDVQDDEDQHKPRGNLKSLILPLYAALPSAQQLKVFETPPDGYRLIVIATNVAETSLTIPGIRYVFDCGRAKEKRYNQSTGVQTFEIDWISKASASQRAGRAGRTGPGHCYRLYSSAVYEQFFAEHTVPEILRTPLESTVLQLKSMEIDKVVNFPFPTSPEIKQLAQADRLLRNLGAIDSETSRITDVGKDVMAFPVSPRYGKILLLAQRNQILAHAIALVAGLAVGDLIIPEVQLNSGVVGLDSGSDSDSDNGAERRRKALATSVAQQRHQAYTRAQAVLSQWDDQSDAIKLLTAIAAHAGASSKNKSADAVSQFCQEYSLREKGMTEVQKLRHQLHNIVTARYPHTEDFDAILSLPSDKQKKILNQVVCAGFIDQVAIRADLLKDETSSFDRKPRRAIEVAYRTLVPSGDVDQSLPPTEQELQRSVFVHPSSVLARLSVDEMPSFIVYGHLSRAPPSTVGEGAKIPRTRMHPLTAVSAKALGVLAEGTPLLHLGKPFGKIEDLVGDAGKKRQCWVSVELRSPVDHGGTTWSLGAWKVVQKRKYGGSWEIEKVLAR